MQVISLNVGLPRQVIWRGKPVRTGIFKEPVAQRLRLQGTQLAGDGQADLSVHGGPEKAVYGYPSEHYAFWRQELGRPELSWGAFGENLTTRGMLEEEVRIGDRFAVGSAQLMVTQPRTPCFKLGIRLDRPDVVKRFRSSGRSGFYFSVLREGEVGPGDSLQLLARDEGSLSVAEVLAARDSPDADADLVRRASGLAALPEEWRQRLRDRLARLEA